MGILGVGSCLRKGGHWGLLWSRFQGTRRRLHVDSTQGHAACIAGWGVLAALTSRVSHLSQWSRASIKFLYYILETYLHFFSLDPMAPPSTNPVSYNSKIYLEFVYYSSTAPHPTSVIAPSPLVYDGSLLFMVLPSSHQFFATSRCFLQFSNGLHYT